MPDVLTIALLYPSLLGTYGDVGNAGVLLQRARWRGQRAQVTPVEPDERIPADADVYVLGGAEDAAQIHAADLLRADDGLTRGIANGASVLAVCAGLQILGETYDDGAGGTRRGAGLLDCRSVRASGARSVGELIVLPEAEQWPRVPPISGFENHQGVTRRGPTAAPLGSVVTGVGNGDGTDGVIQGRVIATYAHGPVLARNPALADVLLGAAMGRLEPLDDEEEEALRRSRIGSATTAKTWKRWRSGWLRPAGRG